MLLKNRGGSSGASTFLGLSDTPSSFVGQALKAARVNSGETALEFYTPTNDPFAWAADWVNAQSYGAAGVITTTTLAATLNAGATSATLTSASSFAIGHGMAIPGAGVAGAELEVILTDVVGNVVSWSGATSTLVSLGQTVHHDDTAAIEAAYATGKHVYLPRGNYNVRRKLTFTTAYQNMKGAGSVYGGTMIWSRVLSDDTLVWKGNYSVLSYLCVAMDAALSPTSGAGIVLGDPTTAKVNITLRYASTLNMRDGLRIDKVNNVQIEEIVISNPRRYAMHLKCAIPAGGGCVNRIILYLGSPSWVGSVLAGFYAEEMDTSRWSNININGAFPILMHFNATGVGLAQLMFNTVVLENQTASTTHAIKMEKSGGTHLQNIFFENLEIQPVSGGPGTIEVGANVKKIFFSNFTLESINGRGFDINGEDVHLANGAILSITGVAEAIRINAGATNPHVSDVRGNFFATGLSIANNVSGCVIHDNNFTGCTTGGSIGTGVRATAKIHDNIGITDWLTSIAATPEFVKQEALVAGIWYRAKGTASTADWVALN